MALLKPIDSNGTGHVCEYWRVTHAAVDHTAGTVTAILSGYRDETARREGLNPLLQNRQVFTWTPEDLELAPGGLHYLTTADLYRAFQRDPLFQDALGDDRAALVELPFLSHHADAEAS